MKVHRFERALFSLANSSGASVDSIRNQYGDFFDFYFSGAGFSSAMHDSSGEWHDSILSYVHDRVLSALFDSVEQKFSDFEPIEQRIENSFRYYKYYYPNDTIPEIITLINGPGPSAFTYGDSLLCIALDNYLGTDFSYYQFLDIPEFLLRKFNADYIVPNCMEVWANHEFPFDNEGKKLIDAMIYQGKVIYFKSRMLPDEPDSIVTGFSENDLIWCRDNEPEIWKFIITYDLLYSTDPLTYSKYLTEAPSTSGMPEEAPGNIGTWIGWSIVSKYMEKNREVTLQQLMNEADAQKILTDSKYKPTR